MNRTWIIWLALVGCWCAGAAQAADVVVKGRDVEGSVVGVTSDGVEFETNLGSGAIVIPWQDVDAIRSDKEFMVLHGEDASAVGRIWGVREGSLLVGDSPDTASQVPFGSIFRSLTREQVESSWLESLRARYRYWSADWGLGFAYTDATTTTSSFDTSLDFERKKGPSRMQFGGYYRLGTTEPQDSEKTTTENRLFGRMRYDYDIFPRIFAFGSMSGTYDSVQRLSIRLDPTTGLGWRFVDRETIKIAARSGGGYVYSRFFGGDTEDYATIVFAKDLEWTLPYDSKFVWRSEYLPSVSDWTGNYLVRTDAVLTVPIIGWLDFRFRIFDEYNNRPSPGTQRNTFTTTAGLAVGF